MSNPWEKIDLNDYESHMSLQSVYQLQALNKIMKEQFTTYDIETLMILGVAGGNSKDSKEGESQVCILCHPDKYRRFFRCGFALFTCL